MRFKSVLLSMKSIDFQVHSKPKQTSFFRRWTGLHKESALRKSLFTHPSIPQWWRGHILPSKSLKRRRPRHPRFLQTRSVTRIHSVGSVHFSPVLAGKLSVGVCVRISRCLPLSLSLSTHWCVLRVSALETVRRWGGRAAAASANV